MSYNREDLKSASPATSIVSIVVDPPSSDEADGGGNIIGIKIHGGNDSDPPIENDNPEEGNVVAANNITSGHNEQNRRKEFEKAKKRAQVHHRKRKKSAHNNDATYVPPYKKNRFRHLPSVLPSKFLLGGNIRDPLNLASLSDARISAELNKATPQSSPLPVQGEVPVFIPKNPQDPLGLTTKTPENVEDIVAGVRKNSCSRRHRHRKRAGRKRTDSECSIGAEGGTNEKGDGGVTEDKNKTDDKIAIAVQQLEVRQNKYTKKERVQETTEPANKIPKLDSASSKEPQPTTSQQSQNATSTSAAKKSKPEVTEKSSEDYEYQDEDSNSKTSGGAPSYNRPSSRHSSEYNFRYSSTYAPSPFAFDDYVLEPSPFESPYSYSSCTPSHYLQPFSPPPLPEIPPFQRRMQMLSNQTTRPQQLSLQRAVFHRPFRPFPNNNKKRGFKNNKADPIVSPVIPQPGSRRRPHHFQHNNNKKSGGGDPTSSAAATQQGNTFATSGSANDSLDSSGGKKYRAKDKVFQFGNYSQYYGYRIAEQGDPRIWALKKEYFEGKEVLDIGCNSGHVTLSIARDFEPKRIHGIDIDYSLITAARKNIKLYMVRDPDNKDVVFPKSLPLLFGAMQPPPTPGEKTINVFPYNVSFAHENYVLQSDSQLDNVKPQYNVIVCLSVTKWIHLNYGDDGMKRFFKRIFLHLHPGGILVLEPQPWSSYSKKKKLTEKIYDMYQSIKFYPESFEDFLLGEVGFASSEYLGTPVHNAKGFQRPLLLYYKADSSTQSTNTNNKTISSATITSAEDEDAKLQENDTTTNALDSGT